MIVSGIRRSCAARARKSFGNAFENPSECTAEMTGHVGPLREI